MACQLGERHADDGRWAKSDVADVAKTFGKCEDAESLGDIRYDRYYAYPNGSDLFVERLSMADPNLKRPLKLDTLDSLVAEARNLLAAGYKSKGRWNLAQTCFHLAEWTRFPMDGFPKPPLILRAFFSALRVSGMAERMKHSILRDGFKAGTPTAPQTVAEPNAMKDQEGVETLAKVIERMKTFDGELQPSPLFGTMDRDLWTKVTLLHAEHHLSFLDAT